MDDETFKLLSARQDRLEDRQDRFETRYFADHDKLDEWRSATDKQIAMVPVMTASFQRMAQLAGATIVAVLAAAISIILFGGSP